MERVQKALVKAQDERDGPAGDAGDAVGQGHAKAVKHSYDHKKRLLSVKDHLGGGQHSRSAQ